MYETNVLGLVRVTQAVLPIMRSQGAGRIVNISSLSGEFAYPFNSIYSGTKHAVEAISEALWYETRHLGISVTVVQPGLFMTGFFDRSLRGSSVDGVMEAYAPVAETVKARRAHLAALEQKPDEVAETIFRAATDDPPQFRYRVGFDSVNLIERRRQSSDADWMTFIAEKRDLVR